MAVTGLKPPPDSNCWAASRATRSRLAESHEQAAPHHHAQAGASAEPIPYRALDHPCMPQAPATPGFRPRYAPRCSRLLSVVIFLRDVMLVSSLLPPGRGWNVIPSTSVRADDSHL